MLDSTIPDGEVNRRMHVRVLTLHYSKDEPGYLHTYLSYRAGKSAVEVD